MTIIVAVEMWAPGCFPPYAPMAAAWPLHGSTDRHSASWAEYGVRSGIWRLLDLLGSHDLRATVAISGAVTEHFPQVVEAVHSAGHEIAAHSWTQDLVPAGLTPEAERRNLRRCTADLLTTHGYLWSGDHADYDRPQVQATSGGRLVRMMHSDYSDVRDGGRPRDYLDLHRDVVDLALASEQHAVASIALHAHVGGRPLLAGYVDRLLAYVQQHRDELWIATCADVARAALNEESGPMTSNDLDSPSILVIGGTGAMGARVVQRLLRTTQGSVTVLTRSPRSARARALTARPDARVVLRAGDLDDPGSIQKAMCGVDWVFCNTDFFATGSVPGEIQQGITALEAARATGVARFVYSSLDSAAALTGGMTPVPHFDAKAAVSAWINTQRADEAMRHVVDGWFTEHVSVLTTAPYFENLGTRLAPQRGRLPDGRDGLVFRLPLGDSGRFPLIGLDDIAWFADHMLRSWQSWGARDLAVAADSLTGHEIARTVEHVTGTPACYIELPLDELEASIPDVGHDYAALARFMQHHDLVADDRDLPMLRRIHPRLSTFADWVRTTGAFGSG